MAVETTIDCSLEVFEREKGRSKEEERTARQVEVKSKGEIVGGW